MVFIRTHIDHNSLYDVCGIDIIAKIVVMHSPIIYLYLPPRGYY